jgi:hypothetical protein
MELRFPPCTEPLGEILERHQQALQLRGEIVVEAGRARPDERERVHDVRSDRRVVRARLAGLVEVTRVFVDHETIFRPAASVSARATISARPF